jgi:hypothetical protein
MVSGNDSDMVVGERIGAYCTWVVVVQCKGIENISNIEDYHGRNFFLEIINLWEKLRWMCKNWVYVIWLFLTNGMKK